MASLFYNKAKTKIAKADIDFDTADLRLALLQTTTTADTEDDVEFMNGFTTLGECTAASYARVDLANQAVNEDLTNNRVEIDADDAAFGALESGNTIQGALLYVHVTNDTDSIPIAFIEFASNLVLDGTAVTVQFNAEGIVQMT